ncbi:hypothetical protein BC827DRAFT_200168 [Russula dissimulans]|nr:hypothetical protein BC827DRAFT_200168 [Russula dissimulans]
MHHKIHTQRPTPRLSADGYPSYARPNDDREIVVRSIPTDNRWIRNTSQNIHTKAHTTPLLNLHTGTKWLNFDTVSISLYHCL